MPFRPGPFHEPKAFCAPWAAIVRPSTTVSKRSPKAMVHLFPVVDRTSYPGPCPVKTSAGCGDDGVDGAVGGDPFAVDDEVVVRRELAADAVEPLQVLLPRPV